MHCAQRAAHGLAGDVNAVTLEDLSLCRCGQMIRRILATITCATTLAPAVLFSIGCGGLLAVFTMQAQRIFLAGVFDQHICAGMYS